MGVIFSFMPLTPVVPRFEKNLPRPVSLPKGELNPPLKPCSPPVKAPPSPKGLPWNPAPPMYLAACPPPYVNAPLFKESPILPV